MGGGQRRKAARWLIELRSSWVMFWWQWGGEGLWESCRCVCTLCCIQYMDPLYSPGPALYSMYCTVKQPFYFSVADKPTEGSRHVLQPHLALAAVSRWAFDDVSCHLAWRDWHWASVSLLCSAACLSRAPWGSGSGTVIKTRRERQQQSGLYRRAAIITQRAQEEDRSTALAWLEITCHKQHNHL